MRFQNPPPTISCIIDGIGVENDISFEIDINLEPINISCFLFFSTQLEHVKIPQCVFLITFRFAS